MPETKDDEPKQKTYAWSFSGGKMNCCESEANTCNVSKLWEAAEATGFHDLELQKATREINAILDAARRTNRDKSRELHFVQVEDRHLLAWVHSDLVGSGNDDRTIDDMLRLKAGPAPKRPGRRAQAGKAKGGRR